MSFGRQKGIPFRVAGWQGCSRKGVIGRLSRICGYEAGMKETPLAGA